VVHPALTPSPTHAHIHLTQNLKLVLRCLAVNEKRNVSLEELVSGGIGQRHSEFTSQNL
jgi:hypothetical protein